MFTIGWMHQDKTTCNPCMWATIREDLKVAGKNWNILSASRMGEATTAWSVATGQDLPGAVTTATDAPAHCERTGCGDNLIATTPLHR